VERSQTFPTPPTSASSVMGSQGPSYDQWNQQGISASVQNATPLAIDTGLSNTRSLPNTPATTPPGNAIHNLQPYQAQQSFDKPVYSAAPQQQSQYATQQQNMARFGQPHPNPYVKSDMGPPALKAGSSSEADHTEIKQDPYAQQGTEQLNHSSNEVEGEHDTDYAHENTNGYSADRSTYNYNTGAVMGSIGDQQTHVSQDQVNGSPHQNGSGRVTPRTTTVPQQQWSSGFNTPPRISQTSALYNAVTDRSSVSNGVADTYSHANYAPGAVNGNKRPREDDDLDYKARAGNTTDLDALKRRKSGRENSMGAISAYDQSQLSRPGNNIIQRIQQR
jgi:enhanced filamentous growth protein 1